MRWVAKLSFSFAAWSNSREKVLQYFDRLVHVLYGDMLIGTVEASATGSEVWTGKAAQGEL